jgi:hypothetical protein
MISTRSTMTLLAGQLMLAGCGGSFINRGLHDQARWLQGQVTTSPTSASEAPEGERQNYESRFEVQVSPSTNRGATHNPNERSDLPDLRLYIRVDGQRTEVGHAENAQTLSTSHPMRLRRGDTVEVRIADRRNSYVRWQYDSRQTDDWSVATTTETPLAQFAFQFEGPGRYFFHRGYAIFFVDFRRLQ